ncbi:MAG: hypothetical protein KDB18_04735, partial [Salinibacterium sp.]|nr:hypothetical protein [Salinibacterium sp.]
MTAMTLIFTLFVCLVAPLRAQSTPPSIAVGVDPRVELLSIIFRLGGHDEYFRPDAQSPYAEA